jgi:hypothetical protein
MLACVAAIDAPNSTIFATTGIFILMALEFVILFSAILTISTRYLRNNQTTGC